MKSVDSVDLNSSASQLSAILRAGLAEHLSVKDLIHLASASTQTHHAVQGEGSSMSLLLQQELKEGCGLALKQQIMHRYTLSHHDLRRRQNWIPIQQYERLLKRGCRDAMRSMCKTMSLHNRRFPLLLRLEQESLSRPRSRLLIRQLNDMTPCKVELWLLFRIANKDASFAVLDEWMAAQFPLHLDLQLMLQQSLTEASQRHSLLRSLQALAGLPFLVHFGLDMSALRLPQTTNELKPFLLRLQTSTSLRSLELRGVSPGKEDAKAIGLFLKQHEIHSFTLHHCLFSENEEFLQIVTGLKASKALQELDLTDIRIGSSSLYDIHGLLLTLALSRKYKLRSLRLRKHQLSQESLHGLVSVLYLIPGHVERLELDESPFAGGFMHLAARTLACSGLTYLSIRSRMDAQDVEGLLHVLKRSTTLTEVSLSLRPSTIPLAAYRSLITSLTRSPSLHSVEITSLDPHLQNETDRAGNAALIYHLISSSSLRKVTFRRLQLSSQDASLLFLRLRKEQRKKKMKILLEGCHVVQDVMKYGVQDGSFGDKLKLLMDASMHD